MSSPLSQNAEHILDRFDDAWNGPTPPRVEDFLPPADSSRYLPILVGLLKIDMEQRCKRGEHVRVEEMYLPRFHELETSPAHLLDLVVHEYELRRQEPGLSTEEYLERWPRFREELARRIHTIRILDSTTASVPVAPPLPRATTALTRSRWGQYELLKELGQGGMGIVYQALDRKHGQHVALKTIRGMNADALYRFKQEFRLRADLHHPNLVSLYELIAEEGNWFFTMELVDGCDFLRYVRGGTDAPGPLAVPEQYQRLRHALWQLIEGIEVLHAAGRLHRDLKPSNVMVTHAGRVVLLDFGLMAELDAHHLHESTTQHLVGTAAYMSPEQARSEALSPASDWYSVGVMLYEALTGRLPFVGAVLQMLWNKQKADPPPPRSLAPDIPADLDALCRALLARDPAARPAGRDCLRLLGDRSADSGPAVETPLPDSALVGREEQLAALTDAYAAMRQRRTVTLFMTGSSGVGKSSLLQQFLAPLRAEGQAVVLTGQCYEQESVPYKAFDGIIDALSRFLRRLPEREVQALLPRDAASLLRVFPTLRRVLALLSVPQGHEAPDPQEIRQRAFASLREMFARLSDRKPVVLCIDDLQWGDADSAALLTELIRPPDAPRFLFVGCHRREENPGPFFSALAEADRLLWSEVDRRELSLDPLSVSEAEALAARLMTSSEAQEGRAAAIARESGGNPFFVYELVRYLRAKAGYSLGEEELDLGEVMWRRIERLPLPTRELLAVVALAARPLPQDVACRASGLAQGGVEELVLLRAQRLIRGSGMSDEHFLVTYHDRIRDGVCLHLSVADTCRLHGQLAQTLETWGHADAEWLATHWGYAGERERAGRYYAIAADQAAETLAFDNAAKLYQCALQLGAHDAEASRHIQRKLGDALANDGRGGEAAQAYQVLVADAAGMQKIELQRKVTEQFLISGHVEEGLTAAQTLLQSVNMSMPSSPARAVLGIVFLQTWLWLRGVKFRERSVVDVSASDLCRVDSSWIMATSLSLIDIVRGAYFQLRNLLLALQVGDPSRIARALALAAAYNACAGPSASRRSRRLLDLSEQIANRVANPHAQGMVLVASGMVAYLDGRLRSALHYSSQAEEFLRNHCTGVHWELTTSRAFQAWSLMYLGEIAEMNRLCARFMKEAQARGDLQGITNLLFYAMPVLSMAADQGDKGYQDLSDELARWTRTGFHVQHANAMTMKVQLLLYLGKATAAEQVFQSMWKLFYRSQLNRVQIMRMSQYELNGKVQLALAREASHPTPYLKEAERNARRLDRENRPDARCGANLLRAGIANCKGDLDQARKLLEIASSGLSACELGLYAASARRRLGQLIGGDHGKALISETDRWMTTQGIRNPARMTAVYAPGFADP